MKKLLFAIFLMSISLNAKAEFMGGVIKTSKGKRMALECMEKLENGSCIKIKLLIKWSKNATEFKTYKIVSLKEFDLRDLRNRANENVENELNDNYITAATMTTLSLGYFGYASGYATPMYVGAAIGSIIDIAKSPIVGILFLSHKASDLIFKRKMIKAFKFMQNSKKLGKKMRLNKRYFKSLKTSIYYID